MDELCVLPVAVGEVQRQGVRLGAASAQSAQPQGKQQGRAFFFISGSPLGSGFLYSTRFREKCQTVTPKSSSALRYAMRSFSLGDRSAASSKAFSAGRVLQGQSVAKSTLSAPWSFTSWVKLAASKKWEAKAVSKYTFFFPARWLAASWGVSMPAHVGRDDGQPGEQVCNLAQHVRRAVNQVGGEGVPPGVEGDGQPQLLRLGVDGQRPLVANEELLVIRVQLNTVQPHLLDAHHLFQRVLRVGVDAAEAVEVPVLGLLGEVVHRGLLVGVGGDVQHHAPGAAPFREVLYRAGAGAVAVSLALADFPQLGSALSASLSGKKCTCVSKNFIERSLQ